MGFFELMAFRGRETSCNAESHAVAAGRHGRGVVQQQKSEASGNGPWQRRCLMWMMEEVPRKTFISSFRTERRQVAGKNANITQQAKGKGNRRWAREFSEIICH